jgi:hypothetical protein
MLTSREPVFLRIVNSAAEHERRAAVFFRRGELHSAAKAGMRRRAIHERRI